jgi:hypothetical protein
MAIIFDNKKGKKAKAANNHTYSGFWLDKDAASLGEAFSGKNNTTVKALKLRKYQRAIANFVKILAQRDVPVVFRGTESWTDNECVVLATDISDKNFDVSAGLALHEASHLKYTDFKVLEALMINVSMDSNHKNTVKQIFNYVEDRRIDNLVFKSSPGYKAYYHKLYDHYFRTPEIANALKYYTEPTFENYMAQMLGMLHPSFNANALPGLREIAVAIDINNIGRLQNSAEALEVSLKVYDIMSAAVEAAEAQAQQPQAGDGEEGEEEDNKQQGAGGGGSEEQQENDESEEQEGEGSAEGTEGAEPQEGEDQQGGAEMNAEAEEPQLTPAEERAMREAIRQAQQLVDGNVEKKQGAHSLSSKLRSIQDSPTDFTPVGEGLNIKMDCIVHEAYKQSSALIEYAQLSSTKYTDRTSAQSTRMRELQNSLSNTISYSSSDHQDKMVFEGTQLGAILGRKLLTRREERSLEQNRLRTGRIDAKRIAHAGYGIENIFNQIHIDKYKKANIHLTLDASGSMGGQRWYNSIKLAAALGKAVSMIDGLELQISTRDTDGTNPMITIVYDSRVNKLGYLQVVLGYINCNSMTPEGLCLEAMLNKKLLVPTTSELDSYLINVCDGSPGFNSYGGMSAINHTARQVKRFKNELGIKHVGFFFGTKDQGGFHHFKAMYGEKQSIAMPDASNAMQIAQHMNKELMSK